MVGRSGGKRPLGKPRYMWEDGIQTDREIALEGTDCISGKFWVQIWT